VVTPVSPRRLVGAARSIPVVRRAIGRLAARDPGRPDLLAVLTYHRVDEPSDDLYPGLISATPGEFEAQVAWLARSYRIVSLGDVVAREAGGAALPPRAVLLTFDDASRDFGEHAWPVLQRHGVPATVFVPTAFPGDPGRTFWWDRLHRVLARPDLPAAIETPVGRLPLAGAADQAVAFRRLRTALKELPHERAMAAADDVVASLGGDAGTGSVLGWDELRSLAAAGLEIGAHTRTHPLLDRVSTAELDREVAGARDDLERELGSAPLTIAYPNGNHSAAVRAAVVRAGYRVAFTTQRGTNDLAEVDWLAVRRINVGRASDRVVLAAQLHRWFRFWR
jgi:peptidoglycan/xylan/chitin deacetylase (PgdA/CDA1 family)